jgi:PAS domain S-box-containing protein
MVEHSPILMIRNLGDATITYVNQAVCDIFSLTREEIIGKKWLTDLTDAEKEKILGTLKESNQNLSSFKNTIYYKLKEGVEKIIEWHTNPIYDSNGKFTGEYQGLGFDVTE